MAEGILRHIGSAKWEAYSAGTMETMVNPTAIKVMKEKGIDISDHYSKTLDNFLGKEFDYVITVCDNAKSACPPFAGYCKRLHWSIEDPGSLDLTGEAKLNAFRKTRDILFNLINKFTKENL